MGWLNEFYRDKEEVGIILNFLILKNKFQQSKEGTYSLLQCSIILKDEHSQKIERWFERNLLDSSATDSDLTDSDQGIYLNFCFFRLDTPLKTFPHFFLNRRRTRQLWW